MCSLGRDVRTLMITSDLSFQEQMEAISLVIEQMTELESQSKAA
jgi:hypothetical protein